MQSPDNSGSPLTIRRPPAAAPSARSSPLPASRRCPAGLETVACFESGRWRCGDTPESEWRSLRPLGDRRGDGGRGGGAVRGGAVGASGGGVGGEAGAPARRCPHVAPARRPRQSSSWSADSVCPCLASFPITGARSATSWRSARDVLVHRLSTAANPQTASSTSTPRTIHVFRSAFPRSRVLGLGSRVAR